jgi:two-component system LytT family response regulator
MTMPIRTLLIDDEAPARRRLRRLLADVPMVEIIGEASQCLEAEQIIRQTRPDLIFLDVEMPGGDGFALIERLPTDARPCIIMLTAHQHFALKAYEHAVFDYLLKPVGPARFATVMRRLVAHLAPPGDQGPSGFRSHLMIPLPDRALAIAVEQIDLVAAERNYVRVHVAATSYLLRGSLGALASELDPALFRQANRSVIVRLEAISEVRPLGHGDRAITLRHGQQLIWSRRFRPQMPQSMR